MHKHCVPPVDESRRRKEAHICHQRVYFLTNPCISKSPEPWKASRLQNQTAPATWYRMISKFRTKPEIGMTSELTYMQSTIILDSTILLGFGEGRQWREPLPVWIPVEIFHPFQHREVFSHAFSMLRRAPALLERAFGLRVTSNGLRGLSLFRLVLKRYENTIPSIVSSAFTLCWAQL